MADYNLTGASGAAPVSPLGNFTEGIGFPLRPVSDGGGGGGGSLAYTPTTPADWPVGTDTIQEALDVLGATSKPVSGGNIAVASDKTVVIQNSITLKGKDEGTYTLPDIASSNIGYLNIPQNSNSANYTAVLTDSGKHLFHPSSDANARTFTIPANASVPYELGTCITFVNQTSQVLSIAITSDTLTLAGSTTTGTRSLAQNGVATALKVGTTSWIISGTGLT